MSNTTEDHNNKLYPIFLLPERFKTLVIGGGNVGLEKLQSLLKNSPQANVSVVSKTYLPETLELCDSFNIEHKTKAFEESDLKGFQVAFLATNDRSENERIHKLCKVYNILTNVADTPDLCDFYLGSVVTKGDLKIGISTNGKSPTLAKRMREFLEEAIPDNSQETLENLNEIRNRITGDFKKKVDKLNEITKSLVD